MSLDSLVAVMYRPSHYLRIRPNLPLSKTSKSTLAIPFALVDPPCHRRRIKPTKYMRRRLSGCTLLFRFSDTDALFPGTVTSRREYTSVTSASPPLDLVAVRSED